MHVDPDRCRFLRHTKVFLADRLDAVDELNLVPELGSQPGLVVS